MNPQKTDAPVLADRGVEGDVALDSLSQRSMIGPLEIDSGSASALPPGFQKALFALNGPLIPFTPEEKAEFNAARAREMSKAEARRRRPLQLELVPLVQTADADCWAQQGPRPCP